MNALERAAFFAHSRSGAFQRRLQGARDIVSQALEVGPAYVACSWGKDSEVLLFLAQEQRPDIAVLHVRERDSDLIDSYPEVIQAWRERFGLPDYREILVETGGLTVTQATRQAWDLPPVALLGLRQQESGSRRISGRKWGPLHEYRGTGRWRAIPLHWWTWEDIWAFIVLHDLPYLRSYDEEGVERARSRTSSVTAIRKGDVRGEEFGRLARLAEHHPEYFGKLVEVAPWLDSRR